MSNPQLTVYMAAPRGFCAGVDRAIKIVEMALEKWGKPVYVRHEIVHNKYVVDELKLKGAIFIKEVEEAPNDRPIIFFCARSAQIRTARSTNPGYDLC